MKAHPNHFTADRLFDMERDSEFVHEVINRRRARQRRYVHAFMCVCAWGAGVVAVLYLSLCIRVL